MEPTLPSISATPVPQPSSGVAPKKSILVLILAGLVVLGFLFNVLAPIILYSGGFRPSFGIFGILGLLPAIGVFLCDVKSKLYVVARTILVTEFVIAVVGIGATIFLLSRMHW
jgi:hypothetical protein